MPRTKIQTTMAPREFQPLSHPRPRTRNDFKIAILCALPLEAGAVCNAFDHDEESASSSIGKVDGDNNAYSTGVIGKHDVVVVHMSNMGNIPSAVAAGHLRASFPNISMIFVVGICGASPLNSTTKEEIILGDCIISTGLIQYDFGRRYPGGFVRKTDPKDAPRKAPVSVQTFLSKLQSSHITSSLQINLAKHLALLQQRDDKARYPGAHCDNLYEGDYVHTHDEAKTTCNKCLVGTGVCGADCNDLGCSRERLISRKRLKHNPTAATDNNPKIHFGQYGCANTVLKSGADRERLTNAEHIIAFEMEGAGVWDSYPTLIVKSVCDYADSHKNKEWQIYAAATAAAGLKSILEHFEVTEKSVDYAKKYHVPFSLDGVPLARQFIDRPKEMQKIEKSLLPEVHDRRKIFVLRGMGGIGKTQLAVEFMQNHKTRFSGIFWLDGSSVDNLKQSIVQQTARIHATEYHTTRHKQTGEVKENVNAMVRAFIDWLKQEGNNKWLVVFDNIDRDHEAVDDPQAYNIKDYLPVCPHGSILITTRLAQLERLGLSHEVVRVDHETARAILDSWHESQYEQDVQILLRRLDGLPLAIAHAGAYLQQTGIGISKYVELYDKQDISTAIFLHDRGPLLDDYDNRSVWTTWSISFEAIREKNSSAANLLIIWSFLDRNDFWYDLLQTACREIRTKDILSRHLGPAATRESSFIEAMALLRGYSLVEGMTGLENSQHADGYMMHAVVHRWLYIYHGMQCMTDLGLSALLIIYRSVPFIDTCSDYLQRQQRLLPHANMCFDRLVDANASEGPTVNHSHFESNLQNTELHVCMEALSRLGTMYFNLKKFNIGSQLEMRALEIAHREFGSAGQQTLEMSMGLVHTYYSQGHLSQAEKLCYSILAAKNHEIGDESRDREVLTILRRLGKVCAKQGKLDEAERLLSQALRGQEKILQKHDSRRLKTIMDIANVYEGRGHWSDAIKVYEQALADIEEVLGPEHYWVLQIYSQLGRNYKDRELYDDAAKLLQMVIARQEKVLGLKDMDTLDSMRWLGEVFLQQGKLGKAEEMLQSVLSAYEEIIDSEDFITSRGALYTMRDLGHVYFGTQPEQARVMYLKALAGFSKHEGELAADCCRLIQKDLQRLDAMEQQKPKISGSENAEERQASKVNVEVEQRQSAVSEQAGLPVIEPELMPQQQSQKNPKGIRKLLHRWKK